MSAICQESAAFKFTTSADYGFVAIMAAPKSLATVATSFFEVVTTCRYAGAG